MSCNSLPKCYAYTCTFSKQITVKSLIFQIVCLLRIVLPNNKWQGYRNDLINLLNWRNFCTYLSVKYQPRFAYIYCYFPHMKITHYSLEGSWRHALCLHNVHNAPDVSSYNGLSHDVVQLMVRRNNVVWKSPDYRTTRYFFLLCQVDW